MTLFSKKVVYNMGFSNILPPVVTISSNAFIGNKKKIFFYKKIHYNVKVNSWELIIWQYLATKYSSSS